MQLETFNATKSKIYFGENILDSHLSKIKNKIFIIDKELNFKFHNQLELKINERNKNQKTVDKLYEYYIEKNVNRKKTTVIAIGGGCLLDIVGYSCSSFMRGINIVYVPTTLLAMVDASIGGKNGINYKGYKNMIGNFYNPSEIIIDTTFLSTLPTRQVNSGIAEVIKYGCIYDETIIDMLLKSEISYEEIIKRSINAKLHFIKNDKYDLDYRHYLNFGHTYGHAIESYYDFKKYTHGEAISIGMNMKFDNEKLKLVCKKFNLPISLEEDIDLHKYIKRDKKNDHNINFIYISKLGDQNEN